MVRDSVGTRPTEHRVQQEISSSTAVALQFQDSIGTRVALCQPARTRRPRDGTWGCDSGVTRTTRGWSVRSIDGPAQPSPAHLTSSWNQKYTMPCVMFRSEHVTPIRTWIFWSVFGLVVGRWRGGRRWLREVVTEPMDVRPTRGGDASSDGRLALTTAAAAHNQG
jgi:hypothetical protein